MSLPPAENPPARRVTWREHPDTVHLPADHPNVLPVETLAKPLDWSAAFPVPPGATPRQRVLELGCATGTFLLHRAIQEPAADLIGVEFANKYFRKAAERARKQKLAQVKLVRAEASSFVSNYMAPNSLDEVHIYHPDPWPKERHHKRRLLQPIFVETLARILRPQGFVVFQSDHREYFEWAEERLARRFVLERRPERWADAPQGRTNWEIKFLREGLPIWRMIARLPIG